LSFLRVAEWQTRVVVIQHVLEQTERSNTARVALKAAPAIELRTFGAQGQALVTDDLLQAWVLWPGEIALGADGIRPSTLVVLDGSWSQARKMLQRVPGLRGLTRRSLTAPVGRQSLRAAPPGGMSTLESIAEAIAILEGPDQAASLRAAHQALIQKQWEERGYVGPQR
jgi:DTW domain-containing protein YfiP